MIDKLAWIEIKDGKILSARTKGRDVFYLPGGKRENGEADHAALIREIKEELDVELVADSLAYFGVFSAQAHGHPAGVNVKMTCYTGAFNGELKASAEIEEIRWLSYADRPTISETDKLIFDYAKQLELLK
jgi:ADP-ribose pyrophosphatase YjhB (NUDIX family)